MGGTIKSPYASQAHSLTRIARTIRQYLAHLTLIGFARTLEAGIRISRVVLALIIALVLAFGAAYKLGDGSGLQAFAAELLLAVVQIAVLAASYRSSEVRRQLIWVVQGFCYLTAGWFIVLAAQNSFAANYAVGLLFIVPALGVGYGVLTERIRLLGLFFAVTVTAASAASYVTGETALLFIPSLICISVVTMYASAGWLAARNRFVESEKRYRAVVEQASDGIFLLDAESNSFIDANPAFCRMTGLTVPQLRETTVQDLLHPMPTGVRGTPDDGRAASEGDRAVGIPMPTAIGHVSERLLRIADGRLLPVELRADRVGHDGRDLLSVVVNDIRSRNEYEERLLRAKESAEEIASFKSSLLTNMSHEIRTPLCSILGWAAVLTDELPDRQRELVGLIEQSGHRLHNTLDSVLELAHLQANAKKLRPTLLDLNEAVASTVDDVARMAESKGLEFQMIRSDEAIWAELDPTCLRRILVHIVDNAVKFTDYGSVKVTVTRRGAEAAIAVEDTGSGISDAFLPSVFDEFKQESEGLARDHEGNGLGLTIAHRLAELIGGRIDVHSERGVGSTFTVYVPAAHQPPVSEARQRARKFARMG